MEVRERERLIAKALTSVLSSFIRGCRGDLAYLSCHRIYRHLPQSLRNLCTPAILARLLQCLRDMGLITYVTRTGRGMIYAVKKGDALWRLAVEKPRLLEELLYIILVGEVNEEVVKKMLEGAQVGTF